MKHEICDCAACIELHKRVNEVVIETIPSCGHEWTQYNGLQETFDYCLICDEKRK